MQLYTHEEMIAEAKRLAEKYVKQFYCQGFDDGMKSTRYSTHYQQAYEFGGDYDDDTPQNKAPQIIIQNLHIHIKE